MNLKLLETISRIQVYLSKLRNVIFLLESIKKHMKFMIK
jgi:hypothetical protein